MNANFLTLHVFLFLDDQPDEAWEQILNEPMTPLKLKKGVKTINIPFYQLRSYSQELESNEYYLLYCEKGMMSRLQAAYLNDDGHQNIAVLELKDDRT